MMLEEEKSIPPVCKVFPVTVDRLHLGKRANREYVFINVPITVSL